MKKPLTWSSKHVEKRIVSALAVGLLVFLSACGGADLIRSFRVALAASGPLVNSLVASGAIKPNDATAITQDFTEGASCADALHSGFKAIPKDAPDAKSRKLKVSVVGLRCFRAIAQRHNFDKNRRVKDAADIAEGILASLVVFYSEPGEMVLSDARSGPKPVNEKALEADLKVKVKQLENAMKP